ncbi:hypothetical protein [Actinomadura sp.]|jgi:hypothetical protein|uniref:hypothetical protein n=1 Tax=Actinomadura sp. TaxID=1989 RepID=UPI003346FAD8
MAPEELPPVPQDEHELVGLLHPESAWTFAWARRVLRDFAGERVSRFLVGRLEPGCWSVLRGDGEWLAVRVSGEAAAETAPAHVASFESAQDAVAYAAGGLIVDERVTIHGDLLREQGVLGHVWDESEGRVVWRLLDEGERLVAAARDEERPRYGESCVPLDDVLAHPGGYHVIERTPGPDGDLFLREHDLFTAHVRSRLPGDFGASTGQVLPENTLLDSYAETDEPYLFTLDTPFERRGLYRSGKDRVRKFFVVRRPLTVHPGFPVRNTTVPTGRRRSGGPSEQGQGYLLPRPIAELLDAGDIARITESETLRIYREQRGQGRRDG